MRALTVNVDMDGVVYRMTKRLRQLMQRDGLVGSNCPTPTTWDIPEAWQMPRKAFWEAFHNYTCHDKLFGSGEAEAGAVEALQVMRSQGHRVRIVTSKTLNSTTSTMQARIDTVRWLTAAGLGNLEVVFTGGYAKQGYPADIVIDDKPALEWVQSKPAVNLLFHQPWNAGIDLYGVSRHERLLRVRDWQHVLHVVDREALL